MDRLHRLVPPPHHPVDAGSLEQFAEIETTLGVRLPDDYKTLITTYGDGQWQEFWFLLNPFTANPYLNLVAESRAILLAERTSRDADPRYPHPIWPEPGGVFPWAITDNGGRFFWLTTGAPNDWPTIYYASRDPDYEKLDLSTSEIVYDLVSGELPLFHEEFGGDTPPAVFTPSSDTT